MFLKGSSFEFHLHIAFNELENHGPLDQVRPRPVKWCMDNAPFSRAYRLCLLSGSRSKARLSRSPFGAVRPLHDDHPAAFLATLGDPVEPDITVRTVIQRPVAKLFHGLVQLPGKLGNHSCPFSAWGSQAPWCPLGCPSAGSGAKTLTISRTRSASAGSICLRNQVKPFTLSMTIVPPLIYRLLKICQMRMDTMVFFFKTQFFPVHHMRGL